MLERKENTSILEMEKKLRESERSIDALINSSQDQIWLVDREYRLVRANKSFFETMRKLYGMDFHVGQNLIFPGLDDEKREQWKGFYARTFHGERFIIEYPGEPGLPLEDKDFEVTFNPVYDEDQGIVGAVCFCREFTEQKQTENLVRQSESHLAEAQKLAQFGNWNFDLITNKVTWSEEMYDVFGTDKKTFLQTHDYFIHQVHKEDQERVLQTSLEAQKVGKPFEIEYRIITPSGETRYIHELGYAERNAEGKVIRLFGTAQNITLHRKSAEEIRLAYRQLREFVVHFQNIRGEERKGIERAILDSLGQQLAVLSLDPLGVRRIGPNRKANQATIALPTLTGYIFVRVRDIVRCQSDSTYTMFFTTNKRKLVICKTMKECEEMLKEFHFFRVHNSHLINLDCIEEYIKGEGGTVRMTDGSSIDVSRRRKEEFIRLLRKL